MKKEYEKPVVERMEFDYSKVITTSSRCIIGGMSATWNDPGNACTNAIAGDN